MTFHVFDTYVKANDGHTIHFDVITDKNDSTTAISFAKEWLKSIGEDNVTVVLQKNVNFVIQNLFQRILKLK